MDIEIESEQELSNIKMDYDLEFVDDTTIKL